MPGVPESIHVSSDSINLGLPRSKPVKLYPKPILLLMYIVERSGVSRDELVEIAEALGYRFVSFNGVKVSRELYLDVNLLKLLNLVKEVDGRIVPTERGYECYRKWMRFVENQVVLERVKNIVEEAKLLKQLSGGGQ